LNNCAFLKALDEATRWIDALESRMHSHIVFLHIFSVILRMTIE